MARCTPRGLRHKAEANAEAVEVQEANGKPAIYLVLMEDVLLDTEVHCFIVFDNSILN